MNPRYPVKYRIAAFHVLRYVDKAGFGTVATSFDQEFTKAGPEAQGYLKAIKNGNAPFQGIYLQNTDD